MEEQQPRQTLGELIRAARDEAGWSQEELAEQLGMSQRWVSDVENNTERSPRIRNLRRLSGVLRLDLAELIIRANLARTRAEAMRVAESDAPVVDPFDPRVRVMAELSALSDADVNVVLELVESLKRHHRQIVAGPAELTPTRTG